MARHISTLCDADSTSVITDAPVVVNPDIASKKASVILLSALSKRNGNMPKREKNTHTLAVSNKPSRRCISVSRGRMPKVINAPAPHVINAEHANALTDDSSPYTMPVSNGTAMKAASIISNHPIMRSTTGILIIDFFCFIS